MKSGNKTHPRCGARITVCVAAFGSAAFRQGKLKSLGQFCRESALRLLFAPLRRARGAARSAAAILAARSTRSLLWSAIRGTVALGCAWLTSPDSALRGLRRVCPKNLVFKRGSIEAADNRLHFFLRGRFHKCEALRFLRFVVADYFDRICYQILCGEPLFNVIGRDPNGQIAQKYGKAHSVCCVYSMVGNSWPFEEERGPDSFACLIITDHF